MMKTAIGLALGLGLSYAAFGSLLDNDQEPKCSTEASMNSIMESAGFKVVLEEWNPNDFIVTTWERHREPNMALTNTYSDGTMCLIDIYSRDD